MRLVLVSVALVVVFALVFTWGDLFGIWPEAPSPIFRNTDLVAGFLFIGAIVLAAVRARRRD
jgi:peptidoglycan/LPS O-acetylase OafA/YrhL